MTAERPVQDNITGFWSLVAPDYDAHAGNVPAPGSSEYAAWVDAVRDWLPAAPADVLDIGTGTGFIALIAAALGHRITAIDLAAPMLVEARREAERRGLQIAFQLADAVAPGLPEASFDAITCRHFLWTLRQPEVALANWRGLLRPGGRVVAVDGFWFESPDGEDPDTEPGPFEQHYTRETRADLPIMALTDTAPVEALFKAAGFETVTVGILDGIHRLAERPPSPSQPWYVVIAARD